jgi:hypothetical protein
MEHHEQEHEFDTLKREGMSYRIVVRSVLWVIVAAVFLAFAVWWVKT